MLEKTKKEEKDKKAMAPQNPLAAMPLVNYEGVYANNLYGKINISVVSGKLTAVIGPKKVKMTLNHWDKNIFAVNWPVYDADIESGFAIFHVDPQSNVTGVTLDFLNQDNDMGVFKRVEEKK